MLDPAAMPELATKVGHDLVTASGDTLLGADDKAGIAEIMAAVDSLAAHPELPRPTFRIGFCPGEEIGKGATLFDIERFGAAWVDTVDGSELGALQDQTFTGREVVMTAFEGRECGGHVGPPDELRARTRRSPAVRSVVWTSTAGLPPGRWSTRSGLRLASWPSWRRS